MVKVRSRSPSQPLHDRSFSTIQDAEPGRRIVEPDGGGLRLRPMHRGVRALGCSPGRGAREPLALFGCELGWVAVEGRQPRVGAVNGHDPIGEVEREVATHVAADVAAGRAERLDSRAPSSARAHNAATAIESMGGPTGASEYP